MRKNIIFGSQSCGKGLYLARVSACESLEDFEVGLFLNNFRDDLCRSHQPLIITIKKKLVQWIEEIDSFIYKLVSKLEL